ncbi:MAG: hypothetical protein WBV82_28785 [Myxococcaceae bacterium]
MSFDEKRAWIYGAITFVVAAVYFAVVLGQRESTPVTDIAYVGPLLMAVGIAIAVNIAANVVAAVMSPEEAGQRDERDIAIRRFGQFIEYYVLVVGVVAALGLTMAKLEHFWIANGIYLAFVMSSLLGSGARIVGYRREVPPW